MLISNFCFKRKIQVTQVQSSINETNQRAPKDDPQISLWIKAKGNDDLLYFVSQRKWDMMIFWKFTSITMESVYINILKKQREHDLKYIKWRVAKSKVIKPNLVFIWRRGNKQKRNRWLIPIANIATTCIKFVLLLSMPNHLPRNSVLKNTMSRVKDNTTNHIFYELMNRHKVGWKLGNM